MVILFTSQFEKIFSSIEEYKKWSENKDLHGLLIIYYGYTD